MRVPTMSRRKPHRTDIHNAGQVRNNRYAQKLCISFFLTLILSGATIFCAEEVIFFDDFESATLGSSPPDSPGKNWTITGAGAWFTAPGTTVNTQNRTPGGSKCLYSPGGGAGQGIGAWNNPGWGPVTNGRAEIWFYDDMASPKHQFVSVDNAVGNNWLAIMVRTATSANTYCYRGSMVGTTATNIDRSLGWHKVEWVRDTSNTSMYLDGVLIYSTPNSNFSDFSDFDLGSWSWDSVAGNTGMWFDDAKVVRGQNQSRYRWYQNNDAENPAPLAAENTAIANAVIGTTYRLRLQVQNDMSTSWSGSRLALRYRLGTSGPWLDFGPGAEWNYADGLGADGAQVANALLTNTDVRQHFIESSPSASSLAVASGQRGEWDFAITPTASSMPGATYYIKAVFTDASGNYESDLVAPYLAQATVTSSAINIWQGTNNRWNRKQNWSLGHPPTATEDAVISGGSANPNVNIANAVCRNLFVAPGKTLAFGANTALTVSGRVLVGAGGTITQGNAAGNLSCARMDVYGTHTISDTGTVTVTGTSTLYYGGTISFTGASSYSVGTLRVYGNFNVTTNANTINANNIYIEAGGSLAHTVATGTVNIAGVFSNNGSMRNTTGGHFRFSGTSSIAGSSTTTRMYNLTLLGGTATVTATADPAFTVLNDVVLTSGTLSAAGKRIVVQRHWTNNGGALSGAGATVRFTGGTAASIDNGSAGTVFQNVECAKNAGVTLTAGRALNIAGSLSVENGVFDSNNLSHSLGGNLTVSGGTFTPGSGTWTFNGASDATIGGAGGTLGSFATATVAKSSSTIRLYIMRAITATGQVGVHSGTLYGTGPISGTVVVASGGKVNPGASPGTLTVTNADFSPGGALQLEINDGGTQDGSQAGTNYDLLNVTGTLTLGGGSTLEILPGSGFTTGKVAYKLASWGAIGSPGSGFATIIPGAPFEVRYDNTNKWLNIGNGVVPTPATIESFAAEAEGFGVLLRWRCASEYENAGFHIWRRPIGAGDGAWMRVNALTIPGRVTNPNPKEYAWLDASAFGAFEYRLESESSRGESEFYDKTAKAVSIPPWVSPLAAAVSTGARGLSAAADRVREAAQAAKGDLIRRKAAEAVEDGRSLVPLKVDVIRPSQTPPFGATASYRGLTSYALSSKAKAAKAKLGPVDAVKIAARGRGMVRVDAADIPAGFDPLRAKVLREGNAVRAVAADRDGIVLWAPGYEDAYTDKDAFFLLARRMQTRKTKDKTSEGLFAKGKRPITEHVSTAAMDFHDVYYQWDAALMPYSYPPWFSGKFLSGGTTHEFAARLRAPADGSGKLTVVLFSQSDVPEEDPDHSLYVTVNDSPVGSASWDGGGRMLSLTFSLPAETLRDGVNSIVLHTPPLASGKRVFSFLHSIIIEYRQRLVWGGGTLEVFASRKGVHEVSGLPSADVWVISVDDPADVAGVPWTSNAGTDGSWTVRFLAPKAGRYAICPKGGESAPVSVEARRVEPLAEKLDYLAVGPAAFGGAVAPLLDARSAEGMKTAFADQERLFDAHGFGRYGPDGIRNALRIAKPKFLLLLGRTSFDYKNYLGQNMDMMCPTVLVSTSRFGEVNGDPMYGDLGKGYPEIAVGRIPAYAASEVSAAVARILAHSAGGSEPYRGVLLTDKLDPTSGDFHAQADETPSAAPDVEWTKIYQGKTHATAAAANAALKTEINAGAAVVFFVGHGTGTKMGRDGIVTKSASSLDGWNGNPVILWVSCNGAYFGVSPNYYSLAHVLLARDGGGSPCLIGSPTYLDSERHAEFMRKVLEISRRPGIRWGEALIEAQKWAAAQPAKDSAFDDMSRTQSLLGDPSLPVQAGTSAALEEAAKDARTQKTGDRF